MSTKNQHSLTPTPRWRSCSAVINLISQSDRAYPKKLLRRLGVAAPEAISVVGSTKLLSSQFFAFLCSREAAGSTILRAFDQAAAWRDTGQCVIGGFHSPIEKECLRILLRGRQPIIVCLARGLEGMRLPADWKKPLAEGRLLFLSPVQAVEGRETRKLAIQRNRLVAALADEVVFAYVTPDGELDQLRQMVADWRVPHRVLTMAAAVYPA